jgi:hypothetical protein
MLTFEQQPYTAVRSYRDSLKGTRFSQDSIFVRKAWSVPLIERPLKGAWID